MLYIGLDVHCKWMTIKGFNPDDGTLVEIMRQSNDEQSLREFFSRFTEPLHGVMESGTNSWAVYRTLKPYFEKLIVVDPATVWGKDIRRGAKTDRRDAIKLAVKMQRDELIPLYVPDEKTQDLRILARAKINASRHVTKTVNEFGSLLKSWGIVLESSLLSKKGQQQLETIKANLPEFSLIVLEKWLEMLKIAQEAENTLAKLVESEAKKDEDCQRLLSIPGVGYLTALVVRAEIGDISRFSKAEQLICYCGLSPSVRQSADSIYFGKLNRFCNKFLKYVLVLRSQSMGRYSKENPMSQTYWRVLTRGKSHAKIAVARQLVRVIFSMLKNKTCWDASKIISRRGSPTIVTLKV
ncbi:MAG: IS110 family transposase [Bacillota bacterium]|nr:IS110 family transposase [Bacillota bacterium]